MNKSSLSIGRVLKHIVDISCVVVFSEKQPQASLLTALSGQYKAEQAKKISAEVLRQKLNTAPAKGKPRGAIYEDIEGDHFEDEKSKTAYTAFKTHQRSQSSPNSPKVIRQDRLAALGPESAPVEERRTSWFSEAPPALPPDNNMAMERRRPSWFASLFSAQDVGIIAERYEAHMASEKDQADGDKGVKDNPLPSEPQFFHQKSDGSFFNDPQPKQPTRKECQEKLSIRDFNVFSPTSM